MNISLSLKRREKDFKIDHEVGTIEVTMQSAKSTELDEILFDAQTQIQVMQNQIRERQEEIVKKSKGKKPNKKDVEKAQEDVRKEFGASVLAMQIEGQVKRLLLQIKKWNIEENGKKVPINFNSLMAIRDYEPDLFEEFGRCAAEVQTTTQKIKEEVEKNSESGQNTKLSK